MRVCHPPCAATAGDTEPVATPVLIRNYCAADRESVMDIWYDGWHSIAPGLVHPHSRPEWRERWVSQIVPTHEIAVAAAENEVLGFVTFNPQTSELSQLFTRLPELGRGIGGMLINWVKNRCPAGVYLYTLEINHRSRRFYEKHGFRESGLSTNALSGLPTVRYEWRDG